MIRWKKLLGPILLQRRARTDLYATIADLLDAEFALERALAVTERTARDQSRSIEAWILKQWRASLTRGRIAEEISNWVPASEAMIFAAYGRVRANALFAGAHRVAELRDRQTAAVREALAVPLLLTFSVLVVLWGAGGYFIPVFAEILPDERWPPLASAFRAVSEWIHAWPHLLAALIAAAALVLRWILLNWKGRGRELLDRVAPFSIYRTVTGSAFLFVLLEYLAAGLDLNERTFNELKRAASPYTRHRIDAIQIAMSQGKGLGAAMMESGHGFPDPALSPVVAALDGVPEWDIKLARFVDRWIRRSEATMKARSAMLNILLSIFITVVIAGLVQTLFGLMDAAGQTTSYR